MSQGFKTPSRVSPQSNGRACLCDDGTYSKKCCDGSLWAQGIGRITAIASDPELILTEDNNELITQSGNQITTQ